VLAVGRISELDAEDVDAALELILSLWLDNQTFVFSTYRSAPKGRIRLAKNEITGFSSRQKLLVNRNIALSLFFSLLFRVATTVDRLFVVRCIGFVWLFVTPLL